MDNPLLGATPAGSVMGIPVYTSLYMTKSVEVKGTWRERLFTRPWRPFRKTKIVQEPSDDIFLVSTPSPFGVNQIVVCHPAIEQKIKDQLRG